MKFLKQVFLLTAILSVFASCDKTEVMSPVTNTFEVSIENVVTPQPNFQSGTFAVPIGGDSPAPLFPGDAYEFTVNAGPNVLPMDGGTRLSFATMFVQSNDLFLAPDGNGIELYLEDGSPLGSGTAEDVTSQIKLWDAGTEVNTITGSESQKPQQAPAAADVGTDENGVVTEITGNTDGLNVFPNVEEVIKVTIKNQNGSEFLVRIENVSDAMTIATPAKGEGTTAPVPMSPGVYVVHTSDNPLFTVGETASEGIEDIAEDGFIDVASADLAVTTGLIVPLSPGVWAVHSSNVNPLFENGMADFGEGLEGIAEDGTPGDAAASLNSKDGVSSSDLFNTAVGAGGPGAIGPGGVYTFTFTAEAGERLSLATMFVQSNDWFYAFPESGIDLFNGTAPISGDVTSLLSLYDAGTEADEYPGAGLNQVIRQGSADNGSVDSNNTVRIVSGAPAIVPSKEQVIKVTITPK